LPQWTFRDACPFWRGPLFNPPVFVPFRFEFDRPFAVVPPPQTPLFVVPFTTFLPTATLCPHLSHLDRSTSPIGTGQRRSQRRSSQLELHIAGSPQSGFWANAVLIFFFFLLPPGFSPQSFLCSRRFLPFFHPRDRLSPSPRRRLPILRAILPCFSGRASLSPLDRIFLERRRVRKVSPLGISLKLTFPLFGSGSARLSLWEAASVDCSLTYFEGSFLNSHFFSPLFCTLG